MVSKVKNIHIFKHCYCVFLFCPAEVSMLPTRLRSTIKSGVEEVVGGAPYLKVAGRSDH